MHSVIIFANCTPVRSTWIKGVGIKWERLRRQNHWLDALYTACAAGHYVGVRLVDEHRLKRPPPHGRPTARELAGLASSLSRQ